jgi:hypothetical protein
MLYDPHNPDLIEAPIGERYLALTLPVGIVSGLMVALGWGAGRLQRKLA